MSKAQRTMEVGQQIWVVPADLSLNREDGHISEVSGSSVSSEIIYLIARFFSTGDPTCDRMNKINCYA